MYEWLKNALIFDHLWYGLNMKYVVKGNYYFDIDLNNQLRITGPGNHLYCGITFPIGTPVDLKSYELVNDQLELDIVLKSNEVRFHAPIITDIRTIRNLTEPKVPKPTYEQLLLTDPESISPHKIETQRSKKMFHLTCTNSYQDGDLMTYGCEIEISSDINVEFVNNYLSLTSKKKKITFKIRTLSNILLENLENTSLFLTSSLAFETKLDDFIYKYYQSAGTDIDHLVRTRKTSSFEYGTIFPRDWIEAADLGEDDFTAETIDYMYEQSMKYVNDKGEGWHEEIIGQYKTKVETREELVDRKMIDIEPHYILGLDRLSNNFLVQPTIQQKFQNIAQFVLLNATEQNLISFKRQAQTDGYYLVGNWRDSASAFPNQKSPLSPYDVNCVFYPESLRMIKKHHIYLNIEPDEKLDNLIEKWSKNKDKYRLFHNENTIGYSLALHGNKNLPIPVAHIDESYDLFYNRPSIEEVDSFARKIIDPQFFYTPVGPMLVDTDSNEYSIAQYHGKVIWPKQVAFAVAGLARQYRYGSEQGWPEIVLENIKGAILVTSEASFAAWKQLKSVPELYYFDPITHKARFYTDQEGYEGQMSFVQLWSAVGARRIIREYLHFSQLE